jgi:flagellar biosynthesis/type III secretory pathway protein FliH
MKFINPKFAISSQANLSKQELDDLERRSIFIHDQRNVLKKATRLGLEQGKREGIQQGIEQGIEQGELKAKLAIAQQLLAFLDGEAICLSTGLSLDAIAKLRNG